ncbi:MAG: hypothetical protein BIFFINMI_01808 [Phycisphaerae bacterium]|nr:hypothetical protein [Phycisphaerae bacterium]
MPHPARIIAVCLMLAGPALADVPALRVVCDDSGAVHGVSSAGEKLDLAVRIVVPLKGWHRMCRLEEATGVKATTADGARQWAGKLPVADGAYPYVLTLAEAAGGFTMDVDLTADSDTAVEGVYVWVYLPVDAFAGGRATPTADPPAKSTPLPRTLPREYHFLNARATGLEVEAPDDKTAVGIDWGRPIDFSLQDERQWNGQSFGLLIPICAGQPPRGRHVTAKLKFTVRLTPDTSPAHLTIGADKGVWAFGGVGGDFCFGTASPVTGHNLANLRVAWGRCEMNLADWEPVNDNDDPATTDLAYFQKRDRPGSPVREDFEMATELTRRKIPFVISTWWVPPWMSDRPDDADRQAQRHIPREKWDEMAESVVAYLLHLKKNYRAEPLAYSFNESNLGVRVKMSGQEHRDLIKLLGPRLEKAGLATRMMLGDTSPADTLDFVRPSAADPEAMKYVSAVAFHCWGGATPKTYAAWADLAGRFKLPLLVTELGVDANFRIRPWSLPGYWLREAEMYQQVLLYARPAGTMQWEFTSDYGFVDAARAADGVKLTPTTRFYVVKHFADLTPPDAQAMASDSDHRRVLLTAFFTDRWEHARVYTFHVTNTGSARKATISGVPKRLEGVALLAVLTTEAEHFRKLPPVTVKEGKIELDLPAECLLTLMNAPGANDH